MLAEPCQPQGWDRGIAQTDEELLAALCGMNQSPQFPFGHYANIQSEHKPLESVMEKPRLRAPLHLQYMVFTLQRSEVRLMYCQRKSLLVADTLSRADNPESSMDGSVGEETAYPHATTPSHLPRRLQAIKPSTKQDVGTGRKTIHTPGLARSQGAGAPGRSPCSQLRVEVCAQDRVCAKVPEQ